MFISLPFIPIASKFSKWILVINHSKWVRIHWVIGREIPKLHDVNLLKLSRRIFYGFVISGVTQGYKQPSPLQVRFFFIYLTHDFFFHQRQPDSTWLNYSKFF